MDWLRELARRLSMLMHRRQFDADLEEEVRLHLELRQAEQFESGMTDSGRCSAPVWQRNVPEGRKPHRVGLGMVRELGAGCSLRPAHVAQVPGLHGCRHPHPRSRHRRKHSDIQRDQWSAAQSASLQESEATRSHKGKRFAPERDRYPETDALILTGGRNQRREDGLHRRNRTCASPGSSMRGFSKR